MLSGRARLSGAARVGAVLRLRDQLGAFPAAKTVFRWLRCDRKARHCNAIHGASRATYRIQAADKGHVLRLAVAVKNRLGRLIFVVSSRRVS